MYFSLFRKVGMIHVKLVLEYGIVYLLVWFLNYFFYFKGGSNKKLKKSFPEFLYLKVIYNIKIRDKDFKKYCKVLCFVNTFIITTIYMIVMYLIEGLVFRIILGVVLLILLIIICYGIIGRIIFKKEGSRNV